MMPAPVPRFQYAPISEPHLRADLELTLVRDIEIARERLFAAWTTRLAEWWGPYGMTTPFCEMDLRPGGAFRTVMRAPDGSEFRTRGVFLEVDPPRRIVYSDAFDTQWLPNPQAFFVAVITFDALPQGGARYTARARHWSKEACDRHERMGFFQSWSQSLDRLVEAARKTG